MSMNREEILKTLKDYNIDRDKCIILSGASLTVQGIVKSTSDIDIATTTDYYNSLNWDSKIGALGKEIKYLDNIEISDNLYNSEKVIEIDGYKFANLEFALEVKEMLYRLKDKNIIKRLREIVKHKTLLSFLGTGNMSNYELKNTSAYIKFDRTMLLIDVGLTTFYELRKKKLLDNLDEIYVAVTHLHPDHVGSLPALILYFLGNDKIKINLIVNSNFKEQRENLKKLLSLNGAFEEYYNFVDVKEVDSFFKIGSSRIHHCDELCSYAYEIIIDDDTTYYYLGDNKDAEHFKSCYKKLRENDYIFTDICLSKNNVHLCLDEIKDIIDNKIDNVIFMHFSSVEEMNLIEKQGYRIATIE